MSVDLPSHLRESRHGAKCHKVPGFKVARFQGGNQGAASRALFSLKP
jgi:hypothetical protein